MRCFACWFFCGDKDFCNGATEARARTINDINKLLDCWTFFQLLSLTRKGALEMRSSSLFEIIFAFERYKVLDYLESAYILCNARGVITHLPNLQISPDSRTQNSAPFVINKLILLNAQMFLFIRRYFMGCFRLGNWSNKLILFARFLKTLASRKTRAKANLFAIKP